MPSNTITMLSVGWQNKWKEYVYYQYFQGFPSYPSFMLKLYLNYILCSSYFTLKKKFRHLSDK